MSRASYHGRYESLVLLFALKVILTAIVPLEVLLIANPITMRPAILPCRSNSRDANAENSERAWRKVKAIILGHGIG
jgi:hypothetical protein